MGLAVRVIPTMLCRGRQLVKGRQFNSWRSVGLAAQAVRIHQTRGVDELILLDIAATPEGRGPDLDLVRELAEICFCPLTIGGGIRSVADAKAVLAAGADKIALGELANSLDEMSKISQRFGRQAIVAAIDVGSDGFSRTRSGTYPWTDALMACKLAESWGAGEILLTSIAREGTMEGYDLDLVRSVAEALTIPVIAHGGCSGAQDMLNAIKAGASAVAAGALFQFTDTTPRECARFLSEHGVEART